MRDAPESSIDVATQPPAAHRRDARTRRARCRNGVEPLQPAEVAALIDEYQRTGDREIRNRVVESRLDIADHLVDRFSRSVGVSADDLRQTAMLAMIRAVDRFDGTRGVIFRTFAARTIEGELKRYLRDRSWAVRPPRRSQELHLDVRRVSEELRGRLGREPSTSEIADELSVPVDQIREAAAAGHARIASGLERTGPDGEVQPVVTGALGGIDPGYESVDRRQEIVAAMSVLDHRALRVLRLRYVEELTQPEIAGRVGLSQSYVSRLLRESLDRVRAAIAPTDD